MCSRPHHFYLYRQLYRNLNHPTGSCRLIPSSHFVSRESALVSILEAPSLAVTLLTVVSAANIHDHALLLPRPCTQPPSLKARTPPHSWYMWRLFQLFDRGSIIPRRSTANLKTPLQCHVSLLKVANATTGTTPAGYSTSVMLTPCFWSYDY